MLSGYYYHYYHLNALKIDILFIINYSLYICPQHSSKSRILHPRRSMGY